jgi:hypothetical protein
VPKRAIYDPASMEAAIQELQSNPELSLTAAARKYGIPLTSFQFNLKKTQDTRNLLVHQQFFHMKNTH